MSHLDKPQHLGNAAGAKPITVRRGFDYHTGEEQVTIVDDLPEHQAWMQRGRHAAQVLLMTSWHNNPQPLTPRQMMSHPDNPCRVPQLALSHSELGWYLEGALSVVWERGRADAGQLRVIPPLVRELLPTPLPDELWERAKDDRPLVDLPERPSPYPYFYDRPTLHEPDGILSEYMKEHNERSKRYQEATALHDSLENEHMVTLAWWRGYRQRVLDNQQTDQQKERV